MFGLHNAISAQLSSKTDPPVAVTRILYIGRMVGSKATLILQMRLFLLRSLTGTFPLSSTTQGIFSGLIHECESHIRIHCLHDLHHIMTGQAALPEARNPGACAVGRRTVVDRRDII